MKKLFTGFIAISFLLPAASVLALEVDREVMPRITLGGRIISTIDVVDFESDPAAESEINIEDSVLLTRFDKRMYGGGVAGATLGIREDDSNLLFHEANVFYWNQNFQTSLGQSRLRNSIIEFPTLRDEDLLTYSHVGNASSNDELHQMFGKLVSVDWIFDQKNQQLGFWAGSLEDEPGLGRDGIDNYGLAYSYEISEDLVYVSHLRHAGITLDRQKVNLVDDEWKTAVILGAEFNLNQDPQANWSMALQAVINNGVDGITLADTVANQSRAKSKALIASWRFTNRPQLLTRWQAALNVAYKDYSDINNASQWTVAPSYVFVLGQGVHLLGQLSHTSFDVGLGDNDDTMLQLGIAFNFDSMFNDNIGERNSILNIEHGYID